MSARDRVVHLIRCDVLIPNGHFRLAHANTENLPKSLKHSTDDTFKRKVRSQRFLIECMQRRALFLRPVRDIPWFELFARECLQVGVFVAKTLFSLCAEIVDERLSL